MGQYQSSVIFCVHISIEVRKSIDADNISIVDIHVIQESWSECYGKITIQLYEYTPC